MAKAIWNGKIIAESDQVVKIFNSFFFPINSVNKNYLKASKKKTTTFWEGIISHYSIIIDNKENPDAAIIFDYSGEMIRFVKDKIAFSKNVKIIL